MYRCTPYLQLEMSVDDMGELPKSSIGDVALCSLQPGIDGMCSMDSLLLRMVLACSMAKKQMQDYKNNKSKL